MDLREVVSPQLPLLQPIFPLEDFVCLADIPQLPRMFSNATYDYKIDSEEFDFPHKSPMKDEDSDCISVESRFELDFVFKGRKCRPFELDHLQEPRPPLSQSRALQGQLLSNEQQQLPLASPRTATTQPSAAQSVATVKLVTPCQLQGKVGPIKRNSKRRASSEVRAEESLISNADGDNEVKMNSAESKARRLRHKIKKVQSYWNGSSKSLSHTFRLFQIGITFDHIRELKDLSGKGTTNLEEDSLAELGSDEAWPEENEPQAKR